MAILHLSAVDVDLETGALGDGSRLTTTELALLKGLAARPGEELSRDQLLRDVWRFPGQIPETRAVDLAIARLRRKVERDPARPDHLLTVQGLGYRFVPRAGPEPAPLPRPANTFVGRTAEQARLRALLDGGARSITLVGPGGAGKTRLAVEVGATRPGVRFCDASEARDRGALEAAVHEVLRPPGGPRQRTLDAVLAEVGSAVLVLDNLEQVVESAAELVPAWLRLAPGLVVVATSREALGVPEEHLVDVGPLLGARSDEAVALLVERARQQDVVLDPADPQLAALVERLDGLPLGLELAAALLRTRGPAEIGAEPDVARRGVPARHRSLEAAVSWSWELLDETDRRALADLAELRGAFPAGAAVALGVTPDRLDGLVRRSLVQRHPGSGRWRLLEAVARFARARQPDPAAAAERHLRWCADDAGEPTLADLEVALDRALGRVGPGFEALFLRLRERLLAGASLARFEEVTRSLLERDLTTPRRVALEIDLAQARETRGDLDGAIAGLGRARALAVGVSGLRASVEGNLASLRLRTGDYAEARALARSSTEAAREDGEGRHIAMRLQFLAGMEMMAGELRQADRHVDEALELAAEWPSTRGGLLHLRARILHLRGEDVLGLLDEVDRLLAETPWLLANSLSLRVGVLQDLGQHDQARALFPKLDRLIARNASDVLLTGYRAVARARDQRARGARGRAAALLWPLLRGAGANRWLAGRVVPHLVPCVPRAEAVSLAEEALGPARRDGLWLAVAEVLAGLCGHPEAGGPERARWRAEGVELCDRMEVLPGAWLRAAFGDDPPGH